MTHVIVAIGAAILLTVVWWDMVFDSQVLRHPTGTLPSDVLATTSSYYRRCTIEGAPMMYLPLVMMVVVLAAIAWELWKAAVTPWVGWLSLALAVWGVVSVAFMAVPRAQRIGRAQDSPDVLSGLARTVFRLHASAAACWIVVIVLQLCVR